LSKITRIKQWSWCIGQAFFFADAIEGSTFFA